MSQSGLEQRMQELLQHSLDQYQSMNSMADLMLNSSLSTEKWHEIAESMRQASVAVEKRDRESQEIKQEYRASRNQASIEVSLLSDRLAALMQTFLMKVSCLEQQALKSKEALLPQIHHGVKAIQMKSAYGKYA